MKNFLIAFVFTLVSTWSFSQNLDETQDKLSVGLVLSGGGAKGLSHIGVLQELEKNGVRIDYIGGTSMGAIIGALYAVGYSPEEMLELIETVDFEAVLSDKVDREYKSLHDKENGEKYALKLPIADGKIGIPLSLSRGQGVLNLLTKLFEPVDSIQDFSKLPIPFYCIGTDVATGKMKVFDSGSLPLAVRASASFPTFFQPVEINNELYIDGGIVSNFPVKVMKSKGVDVIIGSDVQSNLLPAQDVNSILTLLDQIISFGMYEKSGEEKPLVDIYIHPDIGGYSTFTFGDPKQIIDQGQTAAAKNAVAFRKLAEIQGSMEPIERKKIVLENKSFVVSEVLIDGNERYTEEYLIKKIGIKPGDSISYDEVNKRIQSVTYQGTIERLSYKIVPDTNGEWRLRIDLKESKIHSFFKLGAHYDPLYQTGVLLNYTGYNILQKNDLISADLVVGDNLRYNFNYFMDNGKFFGYGFSARYNSFKDNVRVQIPGYNKIDLNYNDFTERIYAEAFYKNRISIGVGLEHKYLKAYTETIPPPEGGSQYYLDKSHYFNTFGYLKADTFDRPAYPKHGMFLDAEYLVYLTSSDYNDNFAPFSQMNFKYSIVGSTLNDKLSAQLFLEGGVSLGDATLPLDYFMGGYGENYINNFVTLYGYDFADLYGDSFAKAALDLRYEIFKNNNLIYSFNVAQIGEKIFQSENIFEDLDYGMAVGYGLSTFIGPIDLKYGWSPKNKSNQWYFDLGFWF
ncbi:patatin-like phospholipase family protein [Flavobacteriaceae bacterium]|nr:patatin-like phospholipase family protein [Flavobacteriaceae bacterium]